jgi:hypothetical protein
MGQVYICKIISIKLSIEKPVQYVYPFNRGIVIVEDTTFETRGGDIAYGDELVFSLLSDCQNVDYNSAVIFSRNYDGSHA